MMEKECKIYQVLVSKNMDSSNLFTKIMLPCGRSRRR